MELCGSRLPFYAAHEGQKLANRNGEWQVISCIRYWPLAIRLDNTRYSRDASARALFDSYPKKGGAAPAGALA